LEEEIERGFGEIKVVRNSGKTKVEGSMFCLSSVGGDNH